LPVAEINNTGQTLTAGTIVLPAGEVRVHPNPNQLVAASWLSSAKQVVDLSYNFTDIDPGSGNGITYYVQKNGSTISSGVLSGTSSGTFNVRSLSVNVGDRVNFVVSPTGTDGNGADHGWDSTSIAANLSTTLKTNLLNIDINGSSGTQSAGVTYSGKAAIGTADDTWNSYSVVSTTAGGNVTPDKSNYLTYSDGSTSTVKFSLSESNPDCHTGQSGSALMDDYIAVKAHDGVAGANPTSTTFTLEGLVAGGAYSLYLYCNPATWPGNTSIFTIGDKFLSNNASGFDGNYVAGRDYVKFANLLADTDGKISGTLTAGGNAYGILNGLQLVNVPEPSGMFLLTSGLLGLFAYAWRKRK